MKKIGNFIIQSMVLLALVFGGFGIARAEGMNSGSGNFNDRLNAIITLLGLIEKHPDLEDTIKPLVIKALTSLFTDVQSNRPMMKPAEMKKDEMKLAEKGKYRFEVKAEMEDGETKIDIRKAGVRHRFEVDTQDKEEIIKIVAEKTGVSLDDVRAVIKFEMEDDSDDQDDDSDEDDDSEDDDSDDDKDEDDDN